MAKLTRTNSVSALVEVEPVFRHRERAGLSWHHQRGEWDHLYLEIHFSPPLLAVSVCRLAQPALTGNAQCRDDRNTCSTEQQFVTRLLTTGSFLDGSYPFIGYCGRP